MNTKKAIIATILEDKSIGNCSNNGISARFNEVYILHPDGWVNLDADNLPENVVEMSANSADYYFFVPREKAEGAGWMMGGCFVYSCDSRFHELFGNYPIPLHDRDETWELYERLSR